MSVDESNHRDRGSLTATPVPAQKIRLQPVSVTRKMAASLPRLREIAQQKGLKMHHLGAGYPHPEVTDPRAFIAHRQAFFQHRIALEGLNDANALPELVRESYSYTDTLGPTRVRERFAQVYGNDHNVTIDPMRLIPTVGASGGINLMCSLCERPGEPVAYLTDAPTYAGFVARASLNQNARFFSVEMDDEGPVPERFAAQIAAAREQGLWMPFYYTVPDGHNPGGFSFSAERRATLMAILEEADMLVVEDAPYYYINYAEPAQRPPSFLSLNPQRTVHLFTGSKIGFPGPRVGFVYTDAQLDTANGVVSLSELLLTEVSGEILFQNPEALNGFEALLYEAQGQGTEQQFIPRDSLWPVAESKLEVYRENRKIILDVLATELGEWPEKFRWTEPEAGFFTVFEFIDSSVRTDDAFIERLVAEYGVVVIPMYDFYPPDARTRDPEAGMNQIRVSFCFNERNGQGRRDDLHEAVLALCAAVKAETGLA